MFFLSLLFQTISSLNTILHTFLAFAAVVLIEFVKQTLYAIGIGSEG